MGKETFKDKIIGFIGHIGWRLFCWSYAGGEEQYFIDSDADHLRRLDTAPIAETKVDDEDRLWVRLDNYLPEKMGNIRLIFTPQQ